MKIRNTSKIVMTYVIFCVILVIASSAQSDNSCDEQHVEKILLGGSLYLPANCDLHLSKTLEVSGNVKIVGNNARFYSNGLDAVFYINSNASLDLSGITISGLNDVNHRDIRSSAAVIQNYGNLSIRDVVVSGNTAYRSLGVGLFNGTGATATITNSRVINNTGIGAKGGGIYNIGVLEVSNSQVEYNDVTFQGEILSDPIYDTHGEGGGIYNLGEMTIIETSISYNKSNFSGGIVNKGSLEISRSQVNQNEAILYKNRGWRGGIGNQGTLIMTDSVVYSNRSTYEGAGIWNGGTISVENSSIYNNSVQPSSRRCEGSGFFNAASFLLQITSVSIHNNYWGSPDGPSGIGTGHGDEICGSNIDFTNFTPWLTTPATIK